jgi:hypothetical protein
MGCCSTVNRTRLKEQLLQHFAGEGIQSQTCGREAVLIFPDGMTEMLRKYAEEKNADEDVLTLYRAAKILRQAMFETTTDHDCARFPKNCQADSVPEISRMFFSILLTGKGSNRDVQWVLTVAQLAQFNARKTPTETVSSHQRHRVTLPLPLYNSLRIHTKTRSKAEVQKQHVLGTGVSYAKVKSEEKRIAQAVLQQAAEEGLVCPLTLRRGIPTISAFDNTDQNFQSATATTAFHGTSHSVIQFPTAEKPGEERALQATGASGVIKKLPSNYTGVQHVTIPGGLRLPQRPSSLDHGNGPELDTLRDSDVSPTPTSPVDHGGNSTPHSPAVDGSSPSASPVVQESSPTPAIPVDHGGSSTSGHGGEMPLVNLRYQDDERQWLLAIAKKLETNVATDENVSWSSHHAAQQRSKPGSTAVTAMLPLFPERSDSPGTVKHNAELAIKLAYHLNPGQVAVLVCDQKLWAPLRKIQMAYPDQFGLDKLIAFPGGLHAEKALWTAMGDILEGSGFDVMLAEAGVATTGSANASLKVTHITRTRRHHQIFAASLGALQRMAYNASGCDEICFDQWCKDQAADNATFQFYDMVLRYEITILAFIRSHRERNFTLYRETLEKLVGLFFATDHFHYARMVAVHLQDISCLSDEAVEFLAAGHFAVQKSERRFSAMPVDQVHEQGNRWLKSQGGVLGMLDEPETLEQWLLAAPETARAVKEFEKQMVIDSEESDSEEEYHHEEQAGFQRRFFREIAALVHAIQAEGNPFDVAGNELVLLHTREIAPAEVAQAMRQLEETGNIQRAKFQPVLDGLQPYDEPIKLVKLPTIAKPRLKRPKENQKEEQPDVIFRKMYIANDVRKGSMDVFFSHEHTRCGPPSLSRGGSLRDGSKADILLCIGGERPGSSDCDALIVDGAAIVHIMSPHSNTRTFADYINDVFIPYVAAELKRTARVDLVFDQYFATSLKQSTRDRRAANKSPRKVVVVETAKIPRNWAEFLSQSDNKQQLFNLLADAVAAADWPANKMVRATRQGAVMCVNGGQMQESDHEEADTRIFLHALDAIRLGAHKVVIRTVDSDVVVLAVALFQQLGRPDLWIALGAGRNFRYICVADAVATVGLKAQGLLYFHAVTGCDTTSFFAHHGKKTAWAALDEGNAPLLSAMARPQMEPFSMCDADLPIVEAFICRWYTSNATELVHVNKLRRFLFTTKPVDVDRLPPTSDALRLHARRAAYQVGIWANSLRREIRPPSPELFGWQLESGDNDQWKPVWSEQPVVALACRELLKCCCKKGCLTNRCSCRKGELPCTELCTCSCITPV